MISFLLKMERFIAMKCNLRDSVSISTRFKHLSRDINELTNEKLEKIDLIGELINRCNILEKIQEQLQNLSLDVERLRVELKNIKDEAVELQKIIDRRVVNIASRIKCVK